MSIATQKAYDYLKDQILSGKIPPGDHLVEADIAAQVGLSRTPVREAIRKLSSEGLLVMRPHLGAVVPSWSQEELEDVFFLRALLESRAAERAAVRLKTANIEILQGLADEMAEIVLARAEGYRARFAHLNGQFHRLIVASADSVRLGSMLDQVIHIPLSMRTITRYDEASLSRSSGHHLELVAAFRARDAGWAASVMRSHVLAAWHAASPDIAADTYDEATSPS
jgi:DNA-binding GntR family transcriptional regulator